MEGTIKLQQHSYIGSGIVKIAQIENLLMETRGRGVITWRSFGLQLYNSALQVTLKDKEKHNMQSVLFFLVSKKLIVIKFNN